MDKLSTRQLCFFFACLAPSGKLLNLPSLLAEKAGNDLLLCALLPIALQFFVIFALLSLSEKTNETAFALVKGAFGKVGVILFSLLFALYFLFSAITPLLEQVSFALSAFYEQLSSFLVFLPFFAFSVFACTKKVSAIGRSADICFPIFTLSLFALFALAALSGDYTALFPIGYNSFFHIAKGSLATLNYFSDSAFLLLFLGHFEGSKKTTRKVLLSYAIGSLLSLAFFAVFYGVYQDLAPKQHFALVNIGKYYKAITTLGRVDLVLGYTLSLVLLFYAVVPLQMSVECLSQLFLNKRTVLSFAVNGVLLVLLYLLKDSCDDFSRWGSEKLFFLFLIFTDLIPLILPLFRRKKRA